MDHPRLSMVVKGFLRGRYRLTAHAEQEREDDAISRREIVEAFGSHSIEIIEDYPNDPRGASVLVLAFNQQGSPLHAVIGLGDPDIVVIVTIYRPDPAHWENWRQRL